MKGETWPYAIWGLRFYCFLCVLEEQHHDKRIDRRRFEAVLRVEASRRLVFCVNEQCANADVLGNAESTQDGVAQKAATDSLPLMSSVHRESGENHYRDGVPGQPLLCT